MSRKHPHHGNRRRGTHPKAHKPRVFLEGTLRVVRPGLAQVTTAEGEFPVARRGIREGMNGDRVQVSLVPMHGRAGQRVAYVQGVLERATANIVGTYGNADPLGVVTPLDGRLVHDFFVLPDDKSAKSLSVCEGDVVSARIVEYPTRTSAGVVTIERRLGSGTDLDVNVEAVIASYGLATEFPPVVRDETQNVEPGVEEALATDSLRRDLRNDVCATVDPADARDFDDAVGCRRREDGGYRVYVHIADVTHYVPWDSSTDIEARMRTCSVYLVDRVIPMLPERLCNDVCSLRPCEDRLAMTVRMDLSSRGEIMDAEAFPSAIRSRARLSYDMVDALLGGVLSPDALPCDDVDRDEVVRALELLDEVAKLREDLRERRGSIDFASVEAKVLLDDEGRPVDVVVRRRTAATQLIEEAMLMANESVAKMLADLDLESAYRVHERPTPEDLAACVPALSELGALGETPAEQLVAGSPYAIREALAAVQGTGGEYLANSLLLKAQKRAIYAPHNEGHYALGAKAYCHFTSPIRRYPDVLVHRTLKWLLAGRPKQAERGQMVRALPQLCRSCSERERVADAAGRASERVKMAELYSQRMGEVFSGMVVGCERQGLYVMLDDTCAEGFVPTRTLGDEWFAYDAEHLRLVGESTGRRWYVGKRVAVEVAEVDIPHGRIDLRVRG